MILVKCLDNMWFKANLLSLNFYKIYFTQFSNKCTCPSDIQITYENKKICTAIETKFLWLLINNNLSWKTHIECIKSKLSSACYAVKSENPCITQYSENYLLFLFLLCDDLWFIIVGALIRQYKDY